MTSDDLESHYLRECIIDLNKHHYLVCGCIVFHCRRTDGRRPMYVRTYGWTFIPGLLGHLSGDDLINLVGKSTLHMANDH